MNAPPYQKLFWGSYHKHTAHLSHAREHGAYLLLIGALWNNEGRLPADDDVLAGYAKLTTKEWLAMKPKLMPLFRVSRGKISQPRVTDDLAKYRSTSGKRKEAGKAGGLASGGKNKGNQEANASVLPTKPEPEPEPKEDDANASFVFAEPKTEPASKPKGRSRPTVGPDDFEAAWKAYPHVEGRSSKPNALTEWRKLDADAQAELVSAIARFVPKVSQAHGDRGAPDMARWLRDGKHLNWQGDTASAIPTASWSGPPAVRTAIVAAKGEEFAAKWIDPYCSWSPMDRTLLVANAYAAKQISQELGPWFGQHKAHIAVAPANANDAPLLASGAAA